MGKQFKCHKNIKIVTHLDSINYDLNAGMPVFHDSMKS